MMHKNLYHCLLSGTEKLIWRKNNRQKVLLGFFHGKDDGEILVLVQCRVIQGWKWMSKKAVDWRLLLLKCQFASVSYHSHITRMTCEPFYVSLELLIFSTFPKSLRGLEQRVWASEYRSWKNHKGSYTQILQISRWVLITTHKSRINTCVVFKCSCVNSIDEDCYF